MTDRQTDGQTDRQTDGQTDARGKTICLPTLKGGDICLPTLKGGDINTKLPPTGTSLREFSRVNIGINIVGTDYVYLLTFSPVYILLLTKTKINPAK